MTENKHDGTKTIAGMQFMADDSREAMVFLLEHGEILTDLSKRIGKAFREHDGNTLLLFDSALRGLVENVADGIQRHEVRFEVEKGSE